MRSKREKCFGKSESHVCAICDSDLKFTKKTSRAPKLAKIFDCSTSLGDDDDDDVVPLPIALKLKVAHICF